MIRVMLTHWHLVAVSVMAVLTPNNAGAKDVGNGKGQQFTTGGCVSDADCRSTCCAEISGSGLGICSAVGAQHQNGKLGCGFTDPNAAVRGRSLSVLCNFANRVSRLSSLLPRLRSRSKVSSSWPRWRLGSLQSSRGYMKGEGKLLVGPDTR